MLTFLLAGVMHAEPAESPPPRPEIAAFNAAVHEAYGMVRTRQAKSPPANTKDRLERMADLDQAGREALSRLDLDHVSESDRRAAQPGFAEIGRQDLKNQAQLKAMMSSSGWFTRRKYGRKAALGAWLVADHAVNDPALMRTVLARLRPLARAGGFEGRQHAILYDRIAVMFDHRPQRYGTQVECRSGEWRPLPVEDPARLDDRRRTAGFREGKAVYLKTFALEPCR